VKPVDRDILASVAARVARASQNTATAQHSASAGSPISSLKSA
jgi:hypothetical protein